jgi:formylglycine-generating enzyme required for sulfatase activity/energy-coupling factor transporter ATP-binding protein EcfA2
MGNPDAVSQDIQAQIEELQEQLISLKAAGSPEIVLQTLRDKITQLENQLHPTGKAEPTDESVGPDRVLATLGDRSVIIGGDAQGLTVITGDGNRVNISPEDVPVDTLLKAYYRSLAAECSRLPLGVIDVEFVRTSRKGDVPLPDVYVDLDVTTPPKPDEEEDRRDWALRLERGDGDDRTALLEAITQENNRRAVLLGEAGSGKTTFVNYLTYLLATESETLPETLQGLLPVRLILRQVAAQHIPKQISNGGAHLLWDALESDIARRLGDLAATILVSVLQQRLMEGGGFVFLDGLDEVPAAGERRQTLLAAVQDLAGQLPKAHVLVTARPYAYAEKTWRLDDFPILALAPFHQEQVDGFVQRWYQAVRESMGWNEPTATEKAKRLQVALRQRPYLADLASRPLLLTLMATLHSSWGQLPEDRADLYEETVKLLLSRWQRAREVRTPSGELIIEPSIADALNVGEKTLRSVLETLAHTVHERQREDPQGREGAADISEGELLVAFKPLLERKQVAPNELIGYLQNRAGLLIARQEGVYAFPHRSFQEYLTACYLANQGNLAETLQNLLHQDPLWWREVFLLAVGKAKQGGLGQAVSVVDYQLPAPEDVGTITENHWRIASLAGQALLELRIQEELETTPNYEPVVNCARRWLVRLLEGGKIQPRERAEAGDVVGKLGDPRFDSDHWYLPDDNMLGFVHIPAGSFLMGSDPEKDPDARDNEQPQHKVTLPEYYLARYPVTVAQFRAFIEETKYDYFDKKFLEDPPNRPIRYIKWFGALAYVRWLQKKLSVVSRQWTAKESLGEIERAFWQGLAEGNLALALPSEAEWEKAARGDGRIYPWGNEPDPKRANYSDTGIGTTSAVGAFPDGASPYGLLDLSGNVYEWTRSLWGKDLDEPDFKYPYDPSDGRESLEAGDSHLRVLRGGAFYLSPRYVRCASRFRIGPGNWDLYLGFRVCVSPCGA